MNAAECLLVFAMLMSEKFAQGQTPTPSSTPWSTRRTTTRLPTLTPPYTTWSPRSTTWSPRSTTWSTRSTTWSPRSTTWSPRSTTWSPRSTTWSTRSTTWSPRSTTWSPRSTTWSTRSTTWSPRSTTPPFPTPPYTTWPPWSTTTHFTPATRTTTRELTLPSTISTTTTAAPWDGRADVVDQQDGQYQDRLVPVFYYSDEKSWYHPFTSDPLDKLDSVDLVKIQRRKALCQDGYVRNGDKCYSTDCGLCGRGGGHQRACGYERRYENGYVRTYFDCCIGELYVNSTAEDPVTMCTTHLKREVINEGPCGVSRYPDVGGMRTEPHIVGGDTARPGEFPWQVSLRDMYGQHRCGGTLLNENFVLTASHCVNAYGSYSVVAGQHSLRYTDPGEQLSEVTGISRHPNHTVSHRSFADVAVLKLRTPFTFSETVTPACLPDEPHDAYTNQEAIISGWGRLSSYGSTPDKLQFAKMTIVSVKDCLQFDRSLDTYCITDGIGDRIRSPCYGDSGGPMVVNRSGRWVNIGVTSYGTGGCATSNYAGYKSVPYHLKWIREMMAVM